MILVDGDTVAYRCGFAVEKTKYLVQSGESYCGYDSAKEAKHAAPEGSVTWSRKEVEPEANALQLVRLVLADISDRYSGSCGDLVVYLSPSVGNFREKIATRAKYKGNRDASVRPVHHGAIRDYLRGEFGARVSDGQEADDDLGIGLSTSENSVAVSFDKDLLQVPGLHYNWVSKEETRITRRQGAMNFWVQVLAGDRVDNIPGIDGIGPSKAAKLLEGISGDKAAWEAVKTAYLQAYGDDGLKFAVETAQLVYVRRKPHEMWQPPE